jgi:uncharacterized protein YdeI (YjbR/CyaY-like superfamily)
MNIAKTLHAKNRREWRAWLKKNHKSAKEIWLIYYNKASGKSRIPYNDAVEEALCFGWIDSIVKKYDKDRAAQRFSPRKPKSNWSEMNIERARRLIKLGKMTKAGLAVFNEKTGVITGKMKSGEKRKQRLVIPADILKALRKDKTVWQNFEKFPESYKRIRIGWIDASRNRPEFFKKRLEYFLKMTRKNKRYGMVQ